MPLRVVFFGTPEFAVPSLRAIQGAGHDVVSVVTQPDRPRGRGHKVSSSPVKAAAEELSLRVEQPLRLAEPQFLDALRSMRADLGVVAAYGRILPAAILAAPRLGMINVHASLLPRWRGAAPVHRSILAGDETTGVTIMRVVQELDAGPMLAKVSTPIGADETSETLEARLAELGTTALLNVMDALARGVATEEPQDPALVTYAKRLERADSRIDWNKAGLEVHNQIRGLQPWPLAAARLKDKRILFHRSQPLPELTHSTPPGTIVRVDPDALVVATAPGAIRLLALQLEGKPVVSTTAFLSGHRVQAGDRLEEVGPAAS